MRPNTSRVNDSYHTITRIVFPNNPNLESTS